MRTRAGRGARRASPPRRAFPAALLLLLLVLGGLGAGARDAAGAPPPLSHPPPRPPSHVAGTERGARPRPPREGGPPQARPPGAPSAPAPTPVDPAYVESLVERARARGLARAPMWLRLGHWRDSFWRSGYLSEVDGPAFFLSPRGQRDPAAELDATLRGFFAPATRDPDRHAVCRFPARLQWLGGQLGLDVARIQVRDCPGLRQFIQLLRPRAITLVFSSYYLARAASAFGHTFLRVEKQDPLATEERRELLDMGVDYGATVDTGNALIYALRGMTGMFRGYFKRLPYYYKVREYNDYESRDLWEYQLDLAPAQVMMVVAHIWELGHTWFDYYYLSENCSYHILGAIEVADPSIHLLDHISTPVIPSETVKALYRNPGLVRRVTYRPSLETQFKARVRGLPGDVLRAIQRLAADPAASLDALTEQQRIAALDAAADLIDMRFADELVFDPGSEARRRKQRLLERRSEIHVPSAELDVAPPWHKAPHLSHGSRRLGLGVGGTADGDVYGRLSFRMALHDMADPPDGYPDLVSFEFLPATVRFATGGDTPFVLEELYFLRIRHINEWTRFNRRPSWDLRAGVRRLTEDECDGCMMGEVAGGGGWGDAFWSGRLAFLATIDTVAGWGPSLAGVKDSGFRLGVGPTATLRAIVARRTALLFAGDWIWLPEQERKALWSVSTTLRTGVGTGSAIDLQLVARPGESSANVSWLLYY